MLYKYSLLVILDSSFKAVSNCNIDQFADTDLMKAPQMLPHSKVVCNNRFNRNVTIVEMYRYLTEL